MPVVVRLARHGAKKRPFYRMVVADSRFPKEGRFIEKIGTYDPLQNPPAVTVDKERLDYWKSKGAQLTPTVASICQEPKEDKKSK